MKKEYLPTMLERGEETEKFKFTNELLERDTSFEIRGLDVERSIEDRDVYINIQSENNNISEWVKGEKAIELGEALIRQGRYALIANMYNRNKITCYQKLKEFIDNGIVNSIILDYLEDEDSHRSESIYKVFRIRLEINKEKMKEHYDEYLHELIQDFNFKDVVRTNLYYNDFIKSMKKRFLNKPVYISNALDLYENKKFIFVCEQSSFDNIEKKIDEYNISGMNTELVNFDENKAPLSNVLIDKHVMIKYLDIDKLKEATKILLYSKKSMLNKYGKNTDTILSKMIKEMCCDINVDELKIDEFNKLIQDIKLNSKY